MRPECTVSPLDGAVFRTPSCSTTDPTIQHFMPQSFFRSAKSAAGALWIFFASRVGIPFRGAYRPLDRLFPCDPLEQRGFETRSSSEHCLDPFARRRLPPQNPPSTRKDHSPPLTESPQRRCCKSRFPHHHCIVAGCFVLRRSLHWSPAEPTD